jgi:hypothetical protein
MFLGINEHHGISIIQLEVQFGTEYMVTGTEEMMKITKLWKQKFGHIQWEERLRYITISKT